MAKSLRGKADSMGPAHDEEGVPQPGGRPNKSQEKRETHALRDLVKRLLALPPAVLDGVPVDEPVREAVAAARRMDRGALARQMRYLTGLLRDADAAAVARHLDALAQPHRRDVQAFQQVEGWRDALLRGDDEVFDRLVARGAERQRLQQLIRAVRSERERGQPPRAARQLFRYLMGLRQAEPDASRDG